MTNFETAGIKNDNFLLLKTLYEMSPKWASLERFLIMSLIGKFLFIEATNVTFYYALSEAMISLGKP